MSLLILQNFLLVLTATFNKTSNTLDFTETPVTCIENEKSINCKKFYIGCADENIYSSLIKKVIEKVTDYSDKMNKNLKFFDSNNSKDLKTEYRRYLQLHLTNRENEDDCCFFSEKILNRIALKTHLLLYLLSDESLNNRNPDKMLSLQNEFLTSLNIVWIYKFNGKLQVKIYDTEKLRNFINSLKSFIDKLAIEDHKKRYLKKLCKSKSNKIFTTTRIVKEKIERKESLTSYTFKNIFISLIFTCTMLSLFVWFTSKKICRGVRFTYKHFYKIKYKEHNF